MNNKISLREMVYSSVFAAVIAVLSQIAFPIAAVPVTLQTFAVALCGYVLGARCAVISVLVYIALGTVGVPVFTGFKGGFQCLFGPTGGFIFGFIALALLCGLNFKNLFIRSGFGVLGLFACHILGFFVYSLVTGVGIFEAFMLVSFPFLLKDVVSVVFACFAAVPIRKALRTDPAL